MAKRLPAMLASIILSAALFTAPVTAASSRLTYQKLPSPGVTLKKKSGYWIECRYSGLGEVCDYVYARVRNAKGSAPNTGIKLQRIKVNDSKLKKKSGYWIECRYSGLGEVCDYVYASPGKPAKPK